MTTTAAQIIDSAAFTLQDVGNAFWSRAELLGYVTDAQRDACLVKPDAYTLNATVTLVAGTKQSLPANGNGFVRIARNMGTAGTVPGRVPRQIASALMDMQAPNWHSATPGSAVMEYVYDERDPKNFYVSPPQPVSGFGQVELVYHAIPALLSAETDSLVLDDVYKTALMHYVVYRAKLKEGEQQSMAEAQTHQAIFQALLGAKDKAEEDDNGRGGK